MGNYYKLVNLDKMESISPGHHGNWGIKERAFFGASHPAKLLLLHALFGRWNGDRIAVVCDEADMGDPGDYYDKNVRDVTLEVLRELVQLRPSLRDEVKDDLWDEAAQATIAEAVKS